MSDYLDAYQGHNVVLDLIDHYLAFGRLVDYSAEHLGLADCDLHDHKEANSTKEVYTLETKQIGVRVNRLRCVIPRRNVIAVSLLGDVAS